MKRKEYPSQKKYRENNPSITFRLKKEDKEKLEAIIEATGKSLSQWMTDFIYDEMDPNEEIKKLADNLEVCKEWADNLSTRIEELENEEKFTVPCSVCGEPIYFSSKDSNWTSEEYPKLIERFGKWHHTTCKPSKSPSQ